MDRMPNPRKPIIELTPRVRAVAIVIILTASAILGSMTAATEAPHRQTQFGRNFDAPVVIVPAPAAAPVIELETPPATDPRPAPASTSRRSEI